MILSLLFSEQFILIDCPLMPLKSNIGIPHSSIYNKNNMDKDQQENAFITETHSHTPSIHHLEQPQSTAESLQPERSLSSRLRAINEDAIQKVCSELQKKHLSISKTKTDLKFSKTSEPKVDEINRQRREIIEKKSQMLIELKKLEKMESSMVKQSRLVEKTKLSMSRLSKEDIQTLKSLKLRKKKHDEQIELKVKEYEEAIVQYREEKRNLEEKMKLEETGKRKMAASEAVSLIMERQAERKIKIKEQQQELIKLKQKRKLFEKLEEDTRKREERISQQIKVEQSVKRLQRRMSHKTLKQHQQAYLKRKEEEQSVRKNKLEHSNVKSTPKFKVLFLENALEDQKRRMKDSADKWNKMVGNIEKNYIFCEKIRQDAKKYLKIDKKSTVQLQETDRKVPNPIERSHIYEKGNEYMKAGNSFALLKPTNRNSESMHLPSVNKQEVEEKENQPKQDYLKERRLKRKHLDPNQKLDKCLQTGQIDKAIDLVSQMGTKQSNSKEMWKAAMAKLKILEKIENSDTV